MSRSQQLPWKKQNFIRKWVTRPAQTVNSPDFIHRPYRMIDGNGTKCYYFPTYVIFKIKNITEFDFESLSANINGVLIIQVCVDYKDKFSPDQRQSDEARVRSTLQKLFKFQFPEEKGNKQKMMKNSIKLQHQGSYGSQSNMAQSSDFKMMKQSKGKIEDLVLKKYLYIQFTRDDPLRLPSKRVFEGQIKQEGHKDPGQGYTIKWTIRKQFTISLSPGTLIEDMIAPFNLLNFKLTMIFEDIDIQLEGGACKQKNQNVKFKFNCMKRVGNNTPQQKRRIFEQLMFTDDGSLGQYDLAETGLNVECEKYLSKQIGEDINTQYRSFKVITFTIPFYKYPIMDALTIFIPLVLITILTLFTFVQGPDLNDKVNNLATLMIVYVGLMPVINDSLPPTTKITLIDLVLYFQLTISVLCLIRGLQISDYTPAQFNAYKVWSDGYFIISVVISAFTGFILASLLIYYCIMKSFYYNLEESDISESDRKLLHWVSPHMHQNARNVKTQIEKVAEERMVGSNKTQMSGFRSTLKDIRQEQQKPAKKGDDGIQFKINTKRTGSITVPDQGPKQQNAKLL